MVLIIIIMYFKTYCVMHMNQVKGKNRYLVQSMYIENDFPQSSVKCCNSDFIEYIRWLMHTFWLMIDAYKLMKMNKCRILFYLGVLGLYTELGG